MLEYKRKKSGSERMQYLANIKYMNMEYVNDVFEG